MNKSTILLATLFEHNTLKELCIANYTYISRNNNFDYKKRRLNLSNIFDQNHPQIVCMNHFCIFVQKKININLLDTEANIILPPILNHPLELTPFIIKNCDWSKNFIDLYLQSKCLNIKLFIQKFYQIDNKNIIINNQIFSNTINNNSNNTIIQTLLNFEVDNIVNIIKNKNLSLGII